MLNRTMHDIMDCILARPVATSRKQVDLDFTVLPGVEIGMTANTLRKIVELARRI